MAKDETQTDIMDLARRTQALFNPNGAAMPQFEHVLKLQQEMAGQTETFARHWFERRQEAAETGLEALREMNANSGADPMAALRVITDWQRGSFKRLNADLQDWVALCTQVTQIGAASQDATQQGDGASSAANKSADQPKSTKSKGRAASGDQSQHATPV